MAKGDPLEADDQRVPWPLRPLTKRRWLPTLTWAVAMLIVSSIPDLDVKAELFPGCDKILHFIEYSVLGLTLRYWSGRSRMLFVAGGVAFGALDELHQGYIPGRHASFWDFLADAGGVGAGFLISRHFIGKERYG